MFKDFKIHNKILLAFSIPIIIILFITINVYYNIQSVLSDYKWVNHSEEVMGKANLLVKDLVDMETGYRAYLITGNEVFLEPYNNGKVEFEKTAENLINTVNDNSSQVDKIREVVSRREEWLQKDAYPLMQMRRDVNAGKTTMDTLIQEVNKANGKRSMDSMRQMINSFTSVEQNLSNKRNESAKNAAEFLINFTWISLSIAIVFCLLIAVFIANLISKPLNQLVNKANDIAKGDLLSATNLQVESNDEVGQLVRVFKNMAENIQNQVTEANNLNKAALEGKLSVRADILKHQGDFRKVIEGMNNTLDAITTPITTELDILVKEALNGNLRVRADNKKYKGDIRQILEGINNTLDAVINPINESVSILQKMSEGDFSSQVAGDYKGEHAILKTSLNTTIDSINKMLYQVHVTSEQVVNGSEQVSSTSQTLSQGATEQAASLEEITSSMQEIGSQIRLNAENASVANQLSGKAMEAAEKGNQQMQELMRAIVEISDSSKSISKIIKVIDEIAFQTNLLALNAAVEAARAGKHGKGFAVVAEEVRSLASRSAEAAKETSELIERAVRKTENVSSTATKTLDVLNEIEKGSTKVADIVAEISAASNEQALGITQVNSGLGQIDQVTQQNTASSEECAAAAEELYGQAEELRFTVSRFKLSVGNNSYGYQGRYQQNRTGSKKSFNKPDLSISAIRPSEVIKLDDEEFGKY